MGDEADLLVKVSEHFPAKINNTSSIHAVKLIKKKLTEAQLSLFHGEGMRSIWSMVKASTRLKRKKQNILGSNCVYAFGDLEFLFELYVGAVGFL